MQTSQEIWASVLFAQRKLDPNFDWMRTVTAKEAQASCGLPWEPYTDPEELQRYVDGLHKAGLPE